MTHHKGDLKPEVAQHSAQPSNASSEDNTAAQQSLAPLSSLPNMLGGGLPFPLGGSALPPSSYLSPPVNPIADSMQANSLGAQPLPVDNLQADAATVATTAGATASLAAPATLAATVAPSVSAGASQSPNIQAGLPQAALVPPIAQPPVLQVSQASLVPPGSPVSSLAPLSPVPPLSIQAPLSTATGAEQVAQAPAQAQIPAQAMPNALAYQSNPLTFQSNLAAFPPQAANIFFPNQAIAQQQQALLAQQMQLMYQSNWLQMHYQQWLMGRVQTLAQQWQQPEALIYSNFQVQQQLQQEYSRTFDTNELYRQASLAVQSMFPSMPVGMGTQPFPAQDQQVGLGGAPTLVPAQAPASAAAPSKTVLATQQTPDQATPTQVPLDNGSAIPLGVATGDNEQGALVAASLAETQNLSASAEVESASQAVQSAQSAQSAQAQANLEQVAPNNLTSLEPTSSVKEASEQTVKPPVSAKKTKTSKKTKSQESGTNKALATEDSLDELDHGLLADLAYTPDLHPQVDGSNLTLDVDALPPKAKAALELDYWLNKEVDITQDASLEDADTDALQLEVEQAAQAEQGSSIDQDSQDGTDVGLAQAGAEPSDLSALLDNIDRVKQSKHYIVPPYYEELAVKIKRKEQGVLASLYGATKKNVEDFKRNDGLFRQANRFLHFMRDERKLSPLTVYAYKGILLRSIVLLEKVIPHPQSLDQGNTKQQGARALSLPRHNTRVRKQSSVQMSFSISQTEPLFYESWDEITPTLFKLLYRELNYGVKRQRRSTASVAQSFHILSAFFNYLVAHGNLTHSPIEGLRAPRVKNVLPHVLSENELSLLLDTIECTTPANYRDKAIMELLFSSGLRVAELTNLNLEDINYDLREVRVLGKGNKERVVPVGSVALNAIRAYLMVRPSFNAEDNERALFLNRYGERISIRSVQMKVKELARKVRLDDKVTPHKLRHAFATQLLIHGADMRSVQDMMGHENVCTTERYTHLNYERLKEVYLKAHPLANATKTEQERKQLDAKRDSAVNQINALVELFAPDFDQEI